MILHRTSESKAKELTEARAKAVSRCNEMVGNTRLMFITDIPGQAAIYSEKEAEAADYISRDPEPTDLSPYPFIEREMQATGMTAYECSQLFLNMAAQWRPLGAQLEGLRIGYNKQISEAATQSEIDIILSDLGAVLETYHDY